MEIRFDPLNEREAEAVAKFLTPTIRAMIHHETPSDMRDDAWHRETAVVDQDLAAMFGTTRAPSTCGQDGPHIQPLEDFNTAGVMVGDIPLDDFHKALREETLKNLQQLVTVGEGGIGAGGSGDLAQSAAPLPPDALLPAAADLFATAPATVPAGQASETPVLPPPAVPVPPPVPAPSAPAAATNPADVDKHGLPWNARIHSGTKAVNADGSWRQRRGLNDPELVKRVEAELRALMAVPVSAVPLPPVSGDTTTASDANSEHSADVSQPVPPAEVTATATTTTATTSVPAPPATVPAPPVSVPVPNVPPPPVVPVPPSSVPATALIPSPPAVPAPPIVAAPAAPITFADVMKKVVSNIASAKITEAEVHAGLTSIGLAAGEIGKMNGRPELIKAMSDYLDQLLISKAGV